eukprot:COSAG06_NODE_14922_length_1114_cov_2.180296_2_plen_283_part_00
MTAGNFAAARFLDKLCDATPDDDQPEGAEEERTERAVREALKPLIRSEGFSECARCCRMRLEHPSLHVKYRTIVVMRRCVIVDETGAVDRKPHGIQLLQAHSKECDTMLEALGVFRDKELAKTTTKTPQRSLNKEAGRLLTLIRSELRHSESEDDQWPTAELEQEPEPEPRAAAGPSAVRQLHEAIVQPDPDMEAVKRLLSDDPGLVKETVPGAFDSERAWRAGRTILPLHRAVHSMHTDIVREVLNALGHLPAEEGTRTLNAQVTISSKTIPTVSEGLNEG